MGDTMKDKCKFIVVLNERQQRYICWAIIRHASFECSRH